MVVVNNGNEDKSATIVLPAVEKLKGKMVAKDLMDGKKTIYSRDGRQPLNVHVSRKDGRLFELTFSSR
jgi:hypothetical protein